MIKRLTTHIILALFLSLNCIASANSTVINFDELSQGLVPNGYAGLIWGTSILSRPYADSTSYSINSDPFYSTPHSSPNYILNGFGVPDLWFEFPFPVNFNGAWLAAPKNNSYAAQKVRFVDDLGQTSIWLELTDTPQFLAANFSGSKRIYVQPVGVFSGIQANGGWYTMDDITYATHEGQPAKIGVFSDGYWYLDANQSWAWDGTPTDSLGIFGLGIAGAIPVVGDWNGDAKTEIGVFKDGIWYLDMNGNGQWDGEGIDVRGVFGVGVPNAKPVIGDWTGNGKTKIGIYADGIWYLDANQNWAWDDEGIDIRGVFGVGLPNVKPVTGDWNGDGITEIGVYSEGNWYLDKNRNWVWDGVPTDTYGVFGVGLPNVVPVTGDWNGDGTTKIGVYSDGNWYLDRNNSWAWEGEPTDTYGAFGTGLPNVFPVVGNW